MSFVYVESVVTHGSEIEANDVGIIVKDSKNSFLERVLILRLNEYVEMTTANFNSFDIESVGDRFDKKICDRCFKYLDSASDFENNRIKKDNVITKRPSCRQCRKQKNGVNISASDRRKWDEQKPKDFTLFTCPICNKTTIAGIARIVLDHNHHTGHVRGWICESCNTGIGRFDDNIEQVERALQWLKTR